jgi:UDP-N-acetylglucosamine transferase subunit ALG13
MHTDGFARLVEALDQIAAETDERLVLQIGSTPYVPKTAEWFAFATQREMEELTQQARIVVSHAGAGSILIALRYRKPLIVIPRRQEYGEHADDHQLELSEKLAATGALLMVRETANLAKKLDEASGFQPRVSDPTPLIAALQREVLATNGRNGG